MGNGLTIEMGKRRKDRWTEGKLDAILESAAPFSGMGAIQLARWLVALSRHVGAISLSYHIAHRLTAVQTPRSYKAFATRRAISSRKQPQDVKDAVARCHNKVLRGGMPIALSALVPGFRHRDPKITDKVMDLVGDHGVVDEYMVPVYGPFGTNAVFSFGFPVSVSELDLAMLNTVALILPSTHCELVRTFASSLTEGVLLSQRERQVLKQIVQGKSRSEIADILELSDGSIDTYTRRVFKKLNVNNKVSAAVAALTLGQILP